MQKLENIPNREVKKTNLKEYKVQKRGGSGVKTAKVTSKTGKLIVAKVLTGEEEELIAMS